MVNAFQPNAFYNRGFQTVTGTATDAFQGNAFFVPGFQTSAQFSGDAFQQCAFGSDAWQTSPCHKDGRSGYWRLFFHEMQEEANAQDKKRKEGIAEEPVKVLEVVATEKPKSRIVVEPLAPMFKPEPLPKFKPKALYTAPAVQEKLASLPSIDNFAVFVQEASTSIIQLALEREKRKKRQQLRRRAAAFLLLAA